MSPSFILYMTEHCHLCEEAKLTFAQVTKATRLQLIDIANNDTLLQQYGILIPVLKEQKSGLQLNWPFDSSQLSHWLNQLKLTE